MSRRVLEHEWRRLICEHCNAPLDMKSDLYADLPIAQKYQCLWICDICHAECKGDRIAIGWFSFAAVRGSAAVIDKHACSAKCAGQFIEQIADVCGPLQILRSDGEP